MNLGVALTLGWISQRIRKEEREYNTNSLEKFFRTKRDVVNEHILEEKQKYLDELTSQTNETIAELNKESIELATTVKDSGFGIMNSRTRIIRKLASWPKVVKILRTLVDDETIFNTLRHPNKTRDDIKSIEDYGWFSMKPYTGKTSSYRHVNSFDEAYEQHPELQDKIPVSGFGELDGIIIGDRYMEHLILLKLPTSRDVAKFKARNDQLMQEAKEAQDYAMLKQRQQELLAALNDQDRLEAERKQVEDLQISSLSDLLVDNVLLLVHNEIQEEAERLNSARTRLVESDAPPWEDEYYSQHEEAEPATKNSLSTLLLLPVLQTVPDEDDDLAAMLGIDEDDEPEIDEENIEQLLAATTAARSAEAAAADDSGELNLYDVD
jgi:hypothetical protein